MTSLSPTRAFSRFGDWIAEERNLPGPGWPFNLIILALLVVSPVPLAALAIEEVTFLFWLVLVIDLAVLLGVTVATFGTPALFVGVIILWFALQRLVVALIAPEVSADLVRLLLTYKEGFYLILLAAGVVSVVARYFRGERALPVIFVADIVAVSFLIWLALVFISDPQSSSSELTYARRFAAPVLFYLGGRLLVARREQLLDSVRLLAAVAVGVALFGLLERFALDIEFWRSGVEATTFYEKQVESGLLPENWTVIYKGVPDGIFISLPLEVPVRRLVSTYLEPTTLSSFLAFALLLLLFVPDLSWRRAGNFSRVVAAAAIVALALAVVATLSRGGIVTFLAGAAFVVGVGWLRAPRLLPSLPRPLLLLPIAALMAIAFAITSFDDPPAGGAVRDVLATRAVSGLQDEPAGGEAVPTIDTPAPLEEIEVHPPGSTSEAANKHLRGLTSGLEEMVDSTTRPRSRGDRKLEREARPGEREYAWRRCGAGRRIGFVLYIGFFATVITSLVVAAWRPTGSGRPSLALAGAHFGLFIVSWVSESASGLLGNAFYLLFAGWALALASPPPGGSSFVWPRKPPRH